MKPLFKTIIGVLVIFIALTITSCSKKSHGYNYSSSAKRGGTSYDPVATKYQPVRKKYIVSGQRKRILGQERPIAN